MKFDVYDDIISPTYQDVLESLLCSPDVSWSWQDSMDNGQYLKGGHPQFVCDIFENGRAFDTAIYHSMIGLLTKIVDDIIPNYRPIRIRGILHTPRVDGFRHYPPHTDTTATGGMSAIYYPTDSTGDTYLFEESDINDNVVIDRFKHLWEPIDSVTPKKGRVILFPSNNYHAGSPTTSDRRLLININFFPKEL